MRWIVLIILALAAGVGLFHIIDVYPDNYVKVYVGKYLIEMSFIGFLFMLTLLTGLLYFGFWLLGATLRSGSLVSRWRKRRGYKKAGDALGSGYLMLIKGDWRRAEKNLIARTDSSAVPYVNYLAAAQAAQEQGEHARRDEYLNAAYKAAPNETLAIGLAKARLHHVAGQHEQAEATLNDIEHQGRKNSQFVAMRVQNFHAQQNWSKVHDLLPLARKLDALPESMIEQYDTQAHRALLVNAQDKARTWKELPKSQQQHADNILTYAQDMVHSGNVSGAEKLVRTAMKHQYDEQLVSFYGKLEADKPAKLRRAVEGWLMARPESAELNLAAGRLAMREQNSELATQYFERAIELGQLPGAYASLGKLYEANSEGGRALQLYRAGLAHLGGAASKELAVLKDAEKNADETSTQVAKTGAQEGELV